MRDYELWYYNKIDTIMETRRMKDLKKYFDYYDTYQLTDLISEE